ncbi:hypothetical protein K438DRAFT_2020416 [Mycena galopus ATCC 62051]|nr:hypothetical protein K438DRAFT_2020416 [Mycena galopus ATCC 62051]
MQYTVDSGQFDSYWNSLTAGLSRTAVCLLLYGLYVNLFMLAIYTLARRRANKRILIVASCVMAIGETAQIAVTIAGTVVATCFVPELVHAQVSIASSTLSAATTPHSAKALIVADNVLLALNVAVADMFFIYRCYVVWGSQGKILVLPVLLMLATLVAATTASASNSVASLEIPCGLAAATNIVLITLTAGRIYWISHQSAKAGFDTPHRSLYSRAIHLILAQFIALRSYSCSLLRPRIFPKSTPLGTALVNRR